MLIDDIALTMHPEVGCRTVIHLLEHFGSAERIYAATETELSQQAGLKPSVARSILNRETHLKAQKELDFVTRRGLQVLTSTSPAYPVRLLECGDYPHVLYVSGTMDFNAGHWLSVVGTRKITPYGSRVCDKLIGELARIVPDLVVVSGLAYGVDVAAHRAALKYGVPTVGVLGHPLTRIYPPEHTDTARRMIARGGAVLSEFTSDARPSRAGFVQRNRLIAGLSEGTLIVESAARGGSLITADMADGYHRMLMAVPGRLDDPCSEGTNRLIRTLKAQMVCSGQEIAEWMNWDGALEREMTSKSETVTLGGFSSWASNAEVEVPVSEPDSQQTGRIRNDLVGQVSERTGKSEKKQRLKENSVTPAPATHLVSREQTAPMDVASAEAKADRPALYSAGYAVDSRADALAEYANERVSDEVVDQELSPAARCVLDLIGRDEPVALDDLSLRAPFPAADLALLLLDLEFRGQICCLPGNRYLKC